MGIRYLLSIAGKKTMPVWTDVEVLKDYVPCSEELLQKSTDTFVIDLAELDAEKQKDRLRKIYNDCSGVTICG